MLLFPDLISTSQSPDVFTISNCLSGLAVPIPTLLFDESTFSVDVSKVASPLTVNDVSVPTDVMPLKSEVNAIVPVLAGIVKVFVPAAAGTSTVTCPELLPLITNAIYYSPGFVGNVTSVGNPDCAGISLNACLYVFQSASLLKATSFACVQSDCSKS